jgi:hypothetical protein
MYSELQNYIAAAQLFGLSRLESGVTTYTDLDSGQTERIWIRTCWMITQKTFNDGYITIVCINSTHWKRGIILIPPMAMTLRENLEEPLRSIKPIDLSGWDDVVQNALQQITIFPLEQINAIHETEKSVPWKFIIQFATPMCSGAFQIWEYSPKTPSLLNLGYSIHQAIVHFGSQYKDNEAVHSYLASHRFLD